MAKILVLACTLVLLGAILECGAYVSGVNKQYLRQRKEAEQMRLTRDGNGGDHRDDSRNWGRPGDFEQYGGGSDVRMGQRGNDRNNDNGNSRSQLGGSFSDNYPSGRNQQRRESGRTSFNQDDDEAPIWD